jgi:AhpD family alkylhydroperoxidase
MEVAVTGGAARGSSVHYDWGVTKITRDPMGGSSMHERLATARVAPSAYQAMRALGQYVETSGLEYSLLELVKLRASFMNGCAYCIDMHTKDAIAAGETTQRLFAVAAWREAPFFTARERAALAWTDSVTDVANQGVDDDLFAEARAAFSERELVDLTMAIITINGWNRLAIAFQPEVGKHTPPSAATR